MVGAGRRRLVGAVIFYLVTNAASWLYLPYPKTLAGLLQALTGGLPGYPPTWEFFRNTLMSGGLFTGLFAGAMKLNEAAEEREEEAEEKEAEPEAKARKPKPDAPESRAAAARPASNADGPCPRIGHFSSPCQP